MLVRCLRCDKQDEPDALGKALFHYICAYCRKDGLREFGKEDTDSELNNNLISDEAEEV